MSPRVVTKVQSIYLVNNTSKYKSFKEKICLIGFINVKLCRFINRVRKESEVGFFDLKFLSGSFTIVDPFLYYSLSRNFKELIRLSFKILHRVIVIPSGR